jgi:hypothetical protein
VLNPAILDRVVGEFEAMDPFEHHGAQTRRDRLYHPKIRAGADNNDGAALA